MLCISCAGSFLHAQWYNPYVDCSFHAKKCNQQGSFCADVFNMCRYSYDEQTGAYKEIQDEQTGIVKEELGDAIKE